jgi:ribonuclease BN (tRNA processing enzyme)
MRQLWRPFISASMTALWVSPALASAQPAKEAAFITLGTGGGPLIRLKRSEPANAVIINGAVYLFDAGDGAQRQLVAAGTTLRQLRAVFISHHHIDHNGGLAPLLVTRWLFNNHTPLPVIGPPGTLAMTNGVASGYRATELAPITIGGPPKPAIATSIDARDLAPAMDEPTLVYNDDNIRVLAVTNDHYHFAPGSPEAAMARSYSFRIEAGGRSFVYTGDTGPSPNLEKLAKGADVLVSEVIDMAAMKAVLDKATDIPAPARAPMMAHMVEDHLTPAQIGILAARAGVKRIVLTHLAPGLDDERSTSGYVAGLAAHYKGPVTVAHDLDRF